MANHDKEKERLARRDIVRFKVTMANNRVDIPTLLMLQRALDKLHEVIEKQARKRIMEAPVQKAKEFGREGKLALQLSNRWFHGTSGDNAHSILENGLRPRGESSSNYPGCPSHPSMVYLSDAFPLF